MLLFHLLVLEKKVLVFVVEANGLVLCVVVCVFLSLKPLVTPSLFLVCSLVLFSMLYPVCLFRSG